MNDDTFLGVIDATPLVSIDLILENSAGQVLLGLRNNRPAQGSWFVPGGRIRKNETLAQAMARISETELGTTFDIADAALIGAYDHIYDDNYLGREGINTHYVVLGHRVLLPEGFEVKRDDQHSELRFWDKSDLMASEDVHANTKAYFR